MRKLYTVIKANRQQSPSWWADFKAKDPDDLPPELLGIQAGNRDETEKMSNDEAGAVMSWASSLNGWWGEGPEIKTARGDATRRPLVQEGRYESATETRSGALVVYHISQTDRPEAHNTRRGEFFFEPRDYSGHAPYGPGYRDAEAALAAAEKHEREEEEKRAAAAAPEGEPAGEGAPPALRAPPRAPRRSPVSAGAAPGGARLAHARESNHGRQLAKAIRQAEERRDHDD